MIPELAHFAAILALWVALLQAGCVAGTSTGDVAVKLRLARRCAAASCALLALSGVRPAAQAHREARAVKKRGPSSGSLFPDLGADSPRIFAKRRRAM